MGNFDSTTPLDTDFISLGDDKIREFKVAIQEALRCGTTEGTESVFPGAAPTTAPVFRYRGLSGATGARPASGQYGFFFDETRNALQRDSGSVWADVGTVIPAGTKMVFYQAAAPTGWTKDATNNDKALRVVSGDGGGSGGTHALSTPPSIAHTHTTAGHSLSVDEMPSHSHTVPVYSTYGGDATICASNTTSLKGTVTTSSVGSGNSHAHGDTGSTTPTAFAPQYIDVIVCTKS